MHTYLFPSPPLPRPTVVTTIILSVTVSSFFRFHASEIMQYLRFCAWLIHTMSSRFIHVVANGRISFVLEAG